MVDKDSSSSEDEEDPVEAEALKELEGERKLKKEVSVGLTLKARASSAMMVYPFVAQVVTLFAVFALSCVLFAAYDRSAPGVAEGDLMFALNLSSFRSRSDGYSGKLTYRAQRSFEQVDEVWDWLETVIADRVVAAEPEHRGGFLPFWGGRFLLVQSVRLMQRRAEQVPCEDDRFVGCYPTLSPSSESKSALNLNGSLPFTAEHKWGAALAVCSSLSGASGDMVEQSKIVGCSISQLGSEALQTCSISGGDGSSYFVTNEATVRCGACVFSVKGTSWTCMQSIAESIDASLLDSAREWVDPSRQLEVAGSLSYASQHGGYFVQLPRSHGATRFVLKLLREAGWIDRATRLLTLDTTVSDNRMQMIGDVRVEFQMWLSGKITMTADAKFVKVGRPRSILEHSLEFALLCVSLALAFSHYMELRMYSTLKSLSVFVIELLLVLSVMAECALLVLVSLHLKPLDAFCDPAAALGTGVCTGKARGCVIPQGGSCREKTTSLFWPPPMDTILSRSFLSYRGVVESMVMSRGVLTTLLLLSFAAMVRRAYKLFLQELSNSIWMIVDAAIKTMIVFGVVLTSLSILMTVLLGEQKQELRLHRFSFMFILRLLVSPFPQINWLLSAGESSLLVCCLCILQLVCRPMIYGMLIASFRAARRLVPERRERLLRSLLQEGKQRIVRYWDKLNDIAWKKRHKAHGHGHGHGHGHVGSRIEQLSRGRIFQLPSSIMRTRVLNLVRLVESTSLRTSLDDNSESLRIRGVLQDRLQNELDRVVHLEDAEHGIETLKDELLTRVESIRDAFVDLRGSERIWEGYDDRKIIAAGAEGGPRQRTVPFDHHKRLMRRNSIVSKTKNWQEDIRNLRRKSMRQGVMERLNTGKLWEKRLLEFSEMSFKRRLSSISNMGLEPDESQ